MTTKPKYAMIPYQREDRDIYVGLEFYPDAPEPKPDAMYQELPLREFLYLLHDRLVAAPSRRDVFVSSTAFICYDHSNLNVRIGPDCFVAFGVDVAAIRDRRLYLPWEAGKYPDFALEMASPSTAENDMREKREIYERLGIGEYWRFDASGGDHYGEPLIGERLVNGRYQRIELTAEADGSVRGYSPTLDLYLSWGRHEEGDGWLYLHDPATGQRLESYKEVTNSRRDAVEQAAAAAERAEAAREQASVARGQAAAAVERAEAAKREAHELREQLRRLQGQ